MERSKWSRVSLLLIVACSAAPRGAGVIPGATASPQEAGARPAEAPPEHDPPRVADPAAHPVAPVAPPAPPSQKPPDGARATVAKDTPALPEALVMLERVCERDLVAAAWTDDADHRELFGMCQAVAVAHDEEARQEKKKDPTAAAQHWGRAVKVDLWFDPPARLARLELARLDKDLSRETFCNAIGALSPPLWCSAALPIEALATANACEHIDRCPPADGSSKPPRFDLRRQLEHDPIDREALEIVGSAACKQAGKDRDSLLKALADGIRGWKTCKARA